MAGLFKKVYSKFSEEKIIRKYLRQLKAPGRQIVDIGASDGKKMSNTYRLFKEGYPGMAIEANPDKVALLRSNYAPFSRVKIIQDKVTPFNVTTLLEEGGIEGEFLLLSLDIDSYDFFVLEAILEKFRPTIVVTEINESIPPPIKFKVLYDEQFAWRGGHFFGYSVACLEEVCKNYDYTLQQLEYNNVFLISNRFSSDPQKSINEIYHRGYWNRPGRRIKFPYNREMDALREKSPDEVFLFLNERFSAFEGKYLLHL